MSSAIPALLEDPALLDGFTTAAIAAVGTVVGTRAANATIDTGQDSRRSLWQRLRGQPSADAAAGGRLARYIDGLTPEDQAVLEEALDAWTRTEGRDESSLVALVREAHEARRAPAGGEYHVDVHDNQNPVILNGPNAHHVFNIGGPTTPPADQ